MATWSAMIWCAGSSPPTKPPRQARTDPLDEAERRDRQGIAALALAARGRRAGPARDQGEPRGHDIGGAGDRQSLCLGRSAGRRPMSEAERTAPVAAEHTAGRESAGGLFDRLRALFGLGPASVRDDLEDALVGAGADNEFTPQERAILTNVLGLHDVRVADVMVPRADIIALGIDTPLSEVLALFRTAGHSRPPVHGETLAHPRGMVHIRDFADYLASAPH